MGTILGAMADAVPNRTMAAEGGTHSNFVFGGVDPETGGYFICYDIAGVEAAIRPNKRCMSPFLKGAYDIRMAAILS